MGQKKKTTTIITILVVLLLAVAVIPDARNAVQSFVLKQAFKSALPTFAVADSTSQDYTCSLGTGLVSSLNRVDFINPDPKIGGAAYLVEFRDLPDSQCLQGTIDNSQISSDGNTATKDLTIGIKSTPQTCNYQIVPRSTSSNIITILTRDIEANCGTNIGKPNYKFNCNDAQTLAESQCPVSNLNPYAYWYDQSGYNRHLACFTAGKSYNTGNINYNHISWNTKVNAIIGGVPYSNSISYGLDSSGNQAGQSSFYLGSNNEIFAEFGGNLLNAGGVLCPSPNSQETHAVNVGGLWLTKDKTKYTSYVTIYENGFNDCFVRARLDYGDNIPLSVVNSCVNIFNGKAYDAINTNRNLYSQTGNVKTFSYVSGTIDKNYQTNIVKLEQSQPLLYPSLIMRIKASTLGIAVTSGQPQIISANIYGFQSSFNSNINVQVKNVGSGIGTFEAGAVCDSPISVLGRDVQTVNPSSTATLIIPITGSSNNDVSFSCRITVTDKQSKLSDTKTVTGTMKGSGTGGCSPVGSTVCAPDGKSVLLCQATGNRVTQQVCGGGCVMSVTGAVCTSAEICGNGLDDDSDGLIDDRDSDCQKKKFPWALTILGVTVVGLIGMLFYVNFKKKGKKRGRK